MTDRDGPRIGVVGLRMGLHLASWGQRTGLRVVAACDRDARRRAAAAEVAPGAALVERWEDLHGFDLDGVVLATTSTLTPPLRSSSSTAGCTCAPRGANGTLTR